MKLITIKRGRNLWGWLVALVTLLIIKYGRVSIDWQWALLAFIAAFAAELLRHRTMWATLWFWVVMGLNAIVHLCFWGFAIEILHLRLATLGLWLALVPGVIEAALIDLVVDTVHKNLKRRVGNTA